MFKEFLKLLESMRHHSWKQIVTLDRVLALAFYFSVFLLVTSQFGSIQKMNLHRGRIISKGNADGRREPARIRLIDALPKGSKFHADIISLRSYRPYPKLLLLIKVTQEYIL
jgi:hypothetical protein